MFKLKISFAHDTDSVKTPQSRANTERKVTQTISIVTVLVESLPYLFEKCEDQLLQALSHNHCTAVQIIPAHGFFSIHVQQYSCSIPAVCSAASTLVRLFHSCSQWLSVWMIGNETAQLSQCSFSPWSGRNRPRPKPAERKIVLPKYWRTCEVMHMQVFSGKLTAGRVVTIHFSRLSGSKFLIILVHRTWDYYCSIDRGSQMKLKRSWDLKHAFVQHCKRKVKYGCLSNFTSVPWILCINRVTFKLWMRDDFIENLSTYTVFSTIK